MPRPAAGKRYDRFEDVDWATWTPHRQTTLLYVLHDDDVLLIRKKVGLGAGKIDGPGGRIEPGETPVDAAIREVQEEAGITPTDVHGGGERAFQFADGYAEAAHVFVAHGFDGAPLETDEAIPLWTPLAELPYSEMWPDNPLWFPLMLAGTLLAGRFLYDGDRLLGYEIIEGMTFGGIHDIARSADRRGRHPGRRHARSGRAGVLRLRRSG